MRQKKREKERKKERLAYRKMNEKVIERQRECEIHENNTTRESEWVGERECGCYKGKRERERVKQTSDCQIAGGKNRKVF